MDDGFIRMPGDGIPASIGGMEPHSTTNGVAPRRRSLRRRVTTARPTEPFDPVNLNEFAQNIDFGVISARPETLQPIDLANLHVGVGGERALELLDRRIAGGDTELLAVKGVMQNCLALISAMPPLAHIGTAPLRPDDRLHEFFDQFLSLLRQQENQMQELQTMINELI